MGCSVNESVLSGSFMIHELSKLSLIPNIKKFLIMFFNAAIKFEFELFIEINMA